MAWFFQKNIVYLHQQTFKASRKMGKTTKEQGSMLEKAGIPTRTCDGVYINGHYNDFNRNVCPCCGGYLIWSSDFMASEVGYCESDDEDEDTIVSYMNCMDCGAQVELVHPNKEQYEEHGDREEIACWTDGALIDLLKPCEIKVDSDGYSVKEGGDEYKSERSLTEVLVEALLAKYINRSIEDL